MKKRLLASLLSASMLLTMTPQVFAAEDLTDVSVTQEETGASVAATAELDLNNGSIVISDDGYTQNGATTAYTGAYNIYQTGSDTTVNTITVESGDHDITLKDVKIDVSGMHDGEDAQKAKACAFDIQSGNVNLTLDGTNVLKSGFTYEGHVIKNNQLCATGWVCAGLSVSENTSVTIDGDGSLNATAGNSDGGVKIEGQSIYWANAGKAAGIGVSCYYNNYNITKATVGDITIDNGTITATGSSNSNGYGGPGIGGGSNVSNITINNGKVTAASGSLGSGCAGIGSAYGHAAKKHIVINNGTVTATGGSAGIGGGAYAPADVTINGGRVTAESKGSGAGIGSGGGAYGGNADLLNETSITITGGTVTATGSAYNTGIGGGGVDKNAAAIGGRPSGNITIEGGTIVAQGGSNAPGIGSGSLGSLKEGTTAKPTSGQMETIKISGGNITAKNGSSYEANEGLAYKLSNGTDSVVTGIGQGMNAGTDAAAAYPSWKLQTADGDAVQLLAVSEVTSLKRNGKNYSPATLNSGDTAYYLLPEGCYDINGTMKYIPAGNVTEEVTALIENLKKIDPEQGSFTAEEIAAVRSYAAIYNSLSDSMQYYVDQNTAGHTLAEIQNAFKGNVDTSVTLKNGDATVADKTLKYGDPYDFSDIVPVKANYKFVGWYLGDTELTKGDSWPYLSDTTLEAKWVSEIEGSGTQSDPYVLKSAANMVALSHISMNAWVANVGYVYGGSEEEFALFGKNGVTAANRTALMSAYYKLDNDIELTTSDQFYGITGFTGHFDGNGHTIKLDIDNSEIVESSDKTETGEDVAVGSSSKRGKFKLVSGGNTAYVDINAGIFNSATGATIENFTTSGSAKVLTNSAFVAVVIGSSNGCTIKNVTNNASLELGATDNTSWAGGIAGTVGSFNPTTFENCHNTADIKAGTFNTSIGNSSAAGICSYQNASATFTNCSNSGKLIAERQTEASGRYSNVGGIVGLANGPVTAQFTNCHNTGAISSQAKSNNAAAGIIVVNGSNTVINLNSCSNAAALTAKSGYAGALVSYKSGISGMPTSATYTDCTHIMKGAGATDYTFGTISAEASDTEDEVVLTIPVETNTDNFYAADRYVSVNGTKVADMASADFQHIYNDFAHNDNILEDNYPFQTEATAYIINTAEDYTNLVKALQGDATAQNAVLGDQFSNASTDAKQIALANIYVKVNNDITLTDLNAIGLGSDALAFGGHVLGQGHTVTYNLSSDALSEAQSTSFGFVAVSDGAEIQDLNFAGDVKITIDPANSKNVYFGAAVVSGSGAKITNCHSAVNYVVSRASTVMNATGGFLEAGGLIAVQTSATVENSTYTGSLSVTSPKFARAGGIAAEFAGSMKNCVVKGNISATLEYDAVLPIFGESAYAGGMTGLVNADSTFESCVAAGSVTAENTSTNTALGGTYGYAYAGGLIGNATTGVNVKNCMALTTHQSKAGLGTSFACTGSIVAKMTNADLTLSGTNWYLKADDTTVADATALDPSVLTGHTFGDTIKMAAPEGVTMASEVASFNDGTVSFTKAVDAGQVDLVYDGYVFYSTTVAVAAKELTSSDVTITGINSSYIDDDAAAEAAVDVIYNGKELVKGTDYTVAQDKDTHKFTVTFQGNYTGSIDQTYTVGENTLAVSSKNYTGVYDGKMHSITVDAPEGSTVQYSEALSAAYNMDTVEKKDVGTYVVYWQASKDAQTVTGSAVIVISKAALTITADDKSMTVGDTMPELTYTVSGLVEGDQLTAPKLTCSADGSTEGTYDIIAAGADAGENYTISYVSGTLTVSRRSSSHHSSGSSSSSTSNTVSASTASNGKVSLDKSTAKKGDTVTVTVTPDAGYQLDKLTVTDAKGNTISVTKKSDGKYTFTMPDSKVTITPTFSKIEDTKPSKNGFDDVASSAWYADAVQYVTDKGLMNGTGDNKFSPSVSTTRGMLMTVLARYAGEDTTGSTPWYQKGMEWAKANGVSDGTNPEVNITREQLVTMLYRYAGSPAADGKLDSFTDSTSVSSYAVNAMQWAVANGIVNGSNGKLNPQNNATRAEVAAILMRFCEMSK